MPYRAAHISAATAVAFAGEHSKRETAFRPTIVILIGLAALPASAQSVDVHGGTPYCLPPIRPLLPISTDLLREYRVELGAEFSEYFDLAGAYLRCLEAAGATTRDEIDAAIADYRRVRGEDPP